MRLKRFASFTTCMIAFAALLVGCESNDVPTSAEKITTLKWYTIGFEPKDYQQVIEQANEYLGEKIGIHLDMTFIDFQNYTQRMSVIVNSGEDFDLAFTCSWAGDYLGNARKGAFLALDPYLETLGQDMKEVIDQKLWDGAKVDGKTYAVPTQKELGVAPMWVFTKEYVDKYDIPVEQIHTLEDLEPWLKVIKEHEPDVVPLYITKGFSYSVMFDLLVDPLGIYLEDNGDLNVINVFETPEMKEDLETIRRYYKAGYINSDSATAQDDKTLKRFVTKADGQPYADEVWREPLGYPVVSSPVTETWITNGSITGAMIGVSANSKNKEKSIEFLNLLNTDPHIRNLLNYGIEGTHYEKIDENTIKFLNKKDYEIPYFSLGNLFITYVTENEPDTKWHEFKDFNDAANSSPALGFKFDPKAVSTEIAVINNVLGEFKSMLYGGTVEVEEYLEKLNSKLKQQGLNRIIEELQKQIDEWKVSH